MSCNEDTVQNLLYLKKIFGTYSTIQTLTLMVFVFLLCTGFEANKGTRFVNGNWGYAAKVAHDQDKPMMVFVGAPYCGFSQKMEEIFNFVDVGTYFNRNFICKKLDSDNPLHNFRASNMGVSTVPAFLFMNKEGKIIHRVTGYRSAEQIVREAEIALRKIEDETRKHFR